MADFRLVERDGVDVLHRWPATEQCNLDDSERDRAFPISEVQARDLVGNGTVKACEHCFP